MPKRARFYFWVQVAGVICLEGLLLAGIQVNEDIYEVIYTVFIMALAASSFWLVWEAMQVYGASYRLLLFFEGIISAGFLTFLAAYAIIHDYGYFPYFLYLTLGKATLLVVAGGSLATAVPLLQGRDRVLTTVLSATWIFHAIVLYAYSINILGNRELWLDIGKTLPALISVASCGYLGGKMWMMNIKKVYALPPE
jgi:hypothetical protein